MSARLRTLTSVAAAAACVAALLVAGSAAAPFGTAGRDGGGEYDSGSSGGGGDGHHGGDGDGDDGDGGGGYEYDGDGGYDGGYGDGRVRGAPAPPAAPPPPPPPPPAPPPIGGGRASGSSGPAAPSSSGTCDAGGGTPVLHTDDPARNLKRVPSPTSLVAYPCPYPPEWRAIRFGTSSLRLVAGGALVREIPFAAEGRPVGLDELTAVIDDADWLAEIAPGVFVLRAALVQTEGTLLDVRAPRVTSVLLADLPAVSLAGNRASATFDGVKVSSWNEAAGAADTSIVDERPYVRYQNGGRLDITRSRFEYLGSDRTSSYGVVWRRGTAGTVSDSVFEHNFFGMYTYETGGIRFERNIVANNIRYGIDPHDNSSNLVFVENDVYGNGSHGIIFSRFVHDSVVQRNHSHHNGGNGIMMDASSNQNLIEDNTVTDNAGEGIVSSSSADLTIRRNTIDGSEVGMRFSGVGADRILAADNAISDVSTGIKVYDRATAATLRSNKVTRASVAAMLLAAPGARLIDNRVVDSRVGYDARSAATIQGGRVDVAERAIDVGSTGTVVLWSAEMVAGDRPIRVAKGGVLSRTASSVRQLDAVRGGGEDVRTLSLVGLLLVGVAVALQAASSVRNRKTPRRATAPAHVRNVS